MISVQYVLLSLKSMCCVAVRDVNEPKIIEDIAVDDETSERNADPCTSSNCMWLKSSDGKVYVPYIIANHFSM